ncbi:hypothetical protein BDR26DRAFT_863362 [Obelidium mucronatum]|nr:hypothetical protein BDR26DRAFT_863362 [Obelidium mucronatum]
MSVILQDPFLLTPHATAATSAVSNKFLAATSSVSDQDVAVLTVQSSGLSVYDTASNHCLHSFSVPAAISFTSPAVFLATEAAVIEADDDVLASSVPRLSGFVYASIIDAAAKSSEARRVWVWAIGETAQAAKIGGKAIAGGPGKPDWAKTFDSSIQHIAAHGHKLLIIFHANNAVALIKHDLVKSSASIKAKPDLGTVVWTQAKTIAQSATGYVTEAVSVLQNTSKGLNARFIRIETKFGHDGGEDSHSISTNEIPLDFGEHLPVSYAFAADQKKLYVALTNSEVRPFNLKTNSLATTIKLDLLDFSCFSNKAAATSSSLPSSFSMKSIGKSYLAVVGTAGQNDLEVLSIWDTRFGTLQLKRVLNEKETGSISGPVDPTTLMAKVSFFSRCFDIEPVSSSISGAMLSITISNIRSKPVKDAVSFGASVYLVPYFCPPVSLLSAFGKLSNTLKFSLEANQEGTLPGLATVAQAPPVKNAVSNNWFTGLTHLEELDRSYVSRICSALTVESMSLELARWIYEKSALTTPNSSIQKPMDGSIVDLSTYPVIEIAQPAMIKLLARAVGNPSDFYPAAVLQYLIRTGRVPACISIPDLKSADQSRSIGIVEQVLSQNDFSTLCLLLDNDKCIGLNEYDILQIVQYVCCISRSTHEDDGEMVRRRSTIDVYVKKQVGSNKTAEYKKCLVRSDKKGGAKVFDGRRWFFERCFAIPQENDFVFAKALKQLSVEQVEVVVGWVVGLLEVDVRLKTEVARKRAAIEKRKESLSKSSSSNSHSKKKATGAAAVAADVSKYGFVDELLENDLDECLAESEIRRQLWWLWDTPGKKNEYSDAVCQAIDVVNLIIDVHLTTILLTPSLHQLVERLRVCISSDLHMFHMMHRKLTGALSVFEVSESAKNKAAISVTGLSGDQKVQKKQEVVGTELRKRWKRMVAQVNDGVGSYAVEVMGI